MSRYVETSRHHGSSGLLGCHLVNGASDLEERSMPKESLAVVGHIGPATQGDKLSPPHALAAFAALGQPTRLTIFQLLMRAEPHGLAAGALAEKVGCPHNTLSSHLSILARSGLVRGERDGRSIIYRADVETIRTLVGFLVDELRWSSRTLPPTGSYKRS